ncbi:hypothetical protein [Gilvibacter sp.]|uniref:hypothetical protein n=1 Tax=Gilvibacter sp. TaxID=2729997 RepID=UPI003F4A62EC
MRVERSVIYKFCKKEVNLECTDLYFFDDFVISQMHEASVYDRDAAYSIIFAISNFFPENKPFHYISNRIHDYSINPVDLKWFLELFPAMQSYHVVFYESPSKSHLELESLFAPIPIIAHKQLIQALDALLLPSNRISKYKR